jgi:cell volume regulation protein A
MDITLVVTYFALLLGFGVIVANLCKRLKLPDAFFLLLLGLVMGPTVFQAPIVTQFVDMTLVNISAMGAVPDFLRILALILIVFMGAFNLKFRTFERLSYTSVKLALVGVVLNTIILGFVANMLFGIDLVYGFLMAAVLSGTGPSVVYALDGTLTRCKKAIDILRIESVFNSPLTVLLPLLFLDLVILQPGALFAPLEYATQFWLMVAAGVGTGLIIGLAVSRIMKGITRKYSPLVMLSIALITYALTENVGGSGILAVAVCGLIAGNFGVREKEKVEITRFEDHLSEMLRISVFTMLGAQVAFFLSFEYMLLALVFYAALFFLRPQFLIPTLGGKFRAMFSKKEIALMSFVGPRGLAAAAMIPIVSSVIVSAGHPAIASLIINLTFLVILLSIFFSTIATLLVRHSMQLEKEEPGKLKILPEEKLARLEDLKKKKSLKVTYERPSEELVTVKEEFAAKKKKKRKRKKKK